MQQFETKYGYFTENGNEFVITNIKTPRPWVNVLTNGNYGLVISQMGGGFSWLTHSEFNRLNRWHQDMLQDNWGKYIYIRNNNTGEFWSPTWQPVKKNLDDYKCTYGFGYTRFETVYKNIKIDLTIFIPEKDSVEIWKFDVINYTGDKIDLSFFTYFEWCLGSSADHHREFHKNFIDVEFDTSLNSMIAGKRLWEIPLGDRGHWNIEYEHKGFLSSSRAVSDYEGDKEKFIGLYGDLANPACLKEGKLSKSTGSWNDPVGSIKIDSVVNENSADQFCIFMGIAKDRTEIKNTLEKYNSPETVSAELERVKDFWAAKLGTLEIQTPDDSMNIMVNKWLRYQAIAGRLWGRTAYYQQSGAFGFRDQLQDSLVFLPIDTSETEKQIRLHARHQMQDGTVLHWWHPISETGLVTKMTDDLLWLPFIITEYLKETGDYKIFNIEEPFYDSSESATLFDHSCRAIDMVLSRFSERGLPLIGAGDWNDGMSAVGLDMKGESGWLAEFLYIILNKYSDYAGKLGHSEIQNRYKECAVNLQKAFNEHLWDGEWFVRATKDSGEKIGSSENTEGRIFLNPQTWSVISGITSKEKSDIALESVKKYLLKKNGPILFSPAYTKPDKYIGYLSRYAPGRRENAGVYTHAATWAIWAFAQAGDRQTACEVFSRLCPVNGGTNPDEYVAEPYVTPGNIDGPDSPQYGRAGWTWYTGSASWFQKVTVDWILGVRASEKGLVIDPGVPSTWNNYSVKRLFRGTVYNINFTRNLEKNNNKVIIKIDGNVLSGNIIPVQNINNCNVEVLF